MALLRHGYVSLKAALDSVALMPVDDAERKRMRARIRRWAALLRERGHVLP